LNGIRLNAVGELVHAILGDEQKAQTTPSANVTWNGGFRSEAQIRQFDPVPSDAPVGFGGDDTAPNPALEGDLDVQAFLGLCKGNAGYGDIKAKVYLDTNASAEEVKDLHEKVTGSSPVGQTLSRTVPVSVELA
jgi:hypothetical protein